MADHRSKYKNAGLDAKELRRRREEDSVQLRKQKRFDILSKKRTFAPVNEPEPQHQIDGDFFIESPSNLPDDGDISSEMIKGIMQTENKELILECAQSIRKILSKEPQPPIDEVIASGAIPRLVELLDCDDNLLVQFEVAWILTNIASGTTEQTHVVVDHGAVPKFVRLLQSQDVKVCEQAVWALGNIIGDGPDLREIVVNHRFVPALIGLIKPDLDINFLRNVTWVIVNLCRNKEPPPSEEVVYQLIPVLCYLIKSTDLAILIDTAWALSYITDLGENYGQFLIDSGLINEITPLLLHPDVKVQTAAIRALGTLSTGNDEQTQSVIDAGAIKHLHSILATGKERVIKEALWFLSNITAGSPDQVQEIINCRVIPLLVQYLDKGDYSQQREAAWAVYNMAISGTTGQIKELVNAKALPSLCNMLGINEPNILQIILETIFNILKSYGEDSAPIAEAIEACGGLDKIENLQQSHNQEIYKIAFKIIDTYFTESDEAEEADVGCLGN